MNIFDLKNNLIDINLELERYLLSKDKIKYDKPTGFIFSEETGEWNMPESGLGEILVHPLFYTQICPKITSTMLALNEVFKNQNYDFELVNIYQLFRCNLYLISRKLKELDDEEEFKGIYYVTYEQMINDIKFTYFHLYCLYFDVGNLCLSDKIKEEYNKSYERLEFFRSKSICIQSMLLDANEAAEEKIEYALLELLEKDERDLFGIILSKELRNSA